jgi:hypothetical protein
LAERFARYRQEEIDALHLAQPLALPELKAQWTAALAEGRSLVDQPPPEESGCAYLDPVSRKPVVPDPASPGFSRLERHFGSVGGAWPVIAS